MADAARSGRAGVLYDLIRFRAERAEAARVHLTEALAPLKTMRVADERYPHRFTTAEALEARFVVAMSLREAVALMRLSAPVGSLNGDGPAARLLCAMGHAQRLVVHASAEPADSQALLAALGVLQIATADCMAHVERGLLRRPKIARKRPRKPPDSGQAG